jgi:hypothetical protein
MRYFPAETSPGQWLAACLCCLFVAVPATALAGAEEARKHYKEAQQLYRKGEYDRAAELLAKAYEEEPNLTYQYNRIRALQGAEQYEKALEVLKTYKRPFLDAKGYEDVREIERTLETKLAPDSTEREETSSDADGAEEGSPSNPSSSTGATSESSDRAQRAEPPSEASPSSSRRASRRPLAWTMIGTGGALVLGGGILSTGIHLWGGDGPPAGGVETSTLTTHRVLAGTALGVGAVAVTGGILLWTGDRERSTAARTGATEPPTIAIVPRLSPGIGGATVEIDF